MKKAFIATILLVLCSTLVFASQVNGKWAATIETDNGPFSFTVTYKVDGEKLSGDFTSDMGDLDFTGGKISGNDFEYSFDIDGYTIKHTGKLVEGEIKIKSTGDYGDSEFTMKKVPK